jgi:DNA-binding response OmpR family regulator
MAPQPSKFVRHFEMRASAQARVPAILLNRDFPAPTCYGMLAAGGNPAALTLSWIGPMRVLVIEDHQRLARLIVEGLAGFGIGADTFPTAEDGLAATRSIGYDALVLDLGLPDRDGLDVIQELRAKSLRTPILILTARGGVDERVEGLDRGADDYLSKPFAMKELAARLRALLRRPGGPLGTTIDIANLSFDTAARQVKVDGRVVAISRRELDALEILVRRADQVVPKRVLEDTIYGLSNEVTANTIEALVSRLRRRLDAMHAGVSIHTLRGIGYLLKE